MTITRTQAVMLIELQAMIAWDDVPRVSSLDDASAEIVSDGVAAIPVEEVRVVEAKVVDIDGSGGPAASSLSRSLGERGGRGEGQLRGRAATAARGYDPGMAEEQGG